MTRLRGNHLQLVYPVPVFPNQGMEELRRCIRLQHGERLASYALTRQSACPWIATLRDARAVPVGARAVAAKEQLFLVPL